MIHVGGYVEALTPRRRRLTYGWHMSVHSQRASVSWTDVALAALLLLFGLVGTGPASVNQGVPEPDVLGYLLVAAACAPIVVWRRYPIETFIASSVATTAYLALGYAYGPIFLADLVTVYGLATREPVRRLAVSVATLLATTAAAVLLLADRGARAELGGVLAWSVFWLGVPAAVGVVLRVRRQSEAGVRAEQARRQVSEERLRMAQEIHDVVGHGLAVIALQAGVALHVLDRDATRAREALEAIRATSKESLDGLRAELDAFRSDGNGVAPGRPQRDLDHLRALVERISAGGLDVQVAEDAVAVELEPEVALAAYRIAQEALTNVLRHAGPAATAQVSLRYALGALLVDVVDTGTSTVDAAVEGNGIRGMRARAEALGGVLDARPRPEGGFAVHARLPLGDSTE